MRINRNQNDQEKPRWDHRRSEARFSLFGITSRPRSQGVCLTQLALILNSLSINLGLPAVKGYANPLQSSPESLSIRANDSIATTVKPCRSWVLPAVLIKSQIISLRRIIYKQGLANNPNKMPSTWIGCSRKNFGGSSFHKLKWLS